MFEYFYHEILRKTVVAFGTLFNNIQIKHTDNNDQVTSVIKVPLAYGPIQKFLARIEQSPNLNKSTAITLPRMSFEFTGLTYDPSRKVTTTQSFKVKDPTTGSQTKKAYMPVPYNMQFELNIMSKLNDDALQILEQIIPFFQPSFNLSVELIESMEEKRDIPIILENITMQDDYEGDFTTRRVLLYTLRFSAKTYLFGPVSTATKDIITSVKIGYLAGADLSNTTREVVYSATPRALKNYTGNVITTLSEDVVITDNKIVVENSSSIVDKTYLDIGGEELYVNYKDNNIVYVERGRDGTSIGNHLRGTEVKSITSNDNKLIPIGDDFGFDGDLT